VQAKAREVMAEIQRQTPDLNPVLHRPFSMRDSWLAAHFSTNTNRDAVSEIESCAARTLDDARAVLREMQKQEREQRVHDASKTVVSR
jgi:hypothetical protein